MEKLRCQCGHKACYHVPIVGMCGYGYDGVPCGCLCYVPDGYVTPGVLETVRGIISDQLQVLRTSLLSGKR